jgi:hypothetical protein
LKRIESTDNNQIVHESLRDLLPLNGVEGGKSRDSHSNSGEDGASRNHTKKQVLQRRGDAWLRSFSDFWDHGSSQQCNSGEASNLVVALWSGAAARTHTHFAQFNIPNHSAHFNIGSLRWYIQTVSTNELSHLTSFLNAHLNYRMRLKKQKENPLVLECTFT